MDNGMYSRVGVDLLRRAGLVDWLAGQLAWAYLQPGLTPKQRRKAEAFQNLFNAASGVLYREHPWLFSKPFDVVDFSRIKVMAREFGIQHRGETNGQ